MTRLRVLVAVGVWLSVVLVLWSIAARPAVAVIGGIVAVTAATIMVAVDLIRASEGLDWTFVVAQGASGRSNPARRAPLSTLLERERRHGSTELRDRLVVIIDDRLLAHHRIDRVADPAGASHVLSPTLRRLTAEPPQRVGSVRVLRRIVTEIEAL